MLTVGLTVMGQDHCGVECNGVGWLQCVKRGFHLGHILPEECLLCPLPMGRKQITKIPLI